MVEILALIVFLVIFYLCVYFAFVMINSLVSPQEFKEYKRKVRELRGCGYTDKQICKELKICKDFLKKLESEETE